TPRCSPSCLLALDESALDDCRAEQYLITSKVACEARSLERSDSSPSLSPAAFILSAYMSLEVFMRTSSRAADRIGPSNEVCPPNARTTVLAQQPLPPSSPNHSSNPLEVNPISPISQSTKSTRVARSVSANSRPFMSLASAGSQ